MDERLRKATIEGDEGRLIRLVKQDPLILDRRSAITTPHLETPLHIAAMLGHAAFVSELLRRKPGLARELDWTRSSALHLASANGHVEVVKALLQADPAMCSVLDRDGRNPVHVAAMRGRTDVLKEMVVGRADAAGAVMSSGGTVFHLCVEYSQFEALKLLVENVDLQDLVNRRDRSGNTALHLAVAHKQVEIAQFLVSLPGTDLKAANLSGMTAVDILMDRRTDARDLEIEKSLKRAGAMGAELNFEPTPSHLMRHNHDDHCSCKNTTKKKKKKKKVKNETDWLDRKISALMVVASLIATMAFQLAATPPAHVWDTAESSNKSNSTKDTAYYVREVGNFLRGERFYIINTTSFIASLSIILLLMSGLPLNNKMVVWILMLITWVAIFDIALSYTLAVIYQTPASNEKSVYPLVVISVFAWICIIVLLLLGHTIRLFFMMVKMVVRSLSVMGRRRHPAPLPEV